MNSNQNDLFLDFFAPEYQIILILIGWSQIFGVRKKAGFSLVEFIFFRANFQRFE